MALLPDLAIKSDGTIIYAGGELLGAEARNNWRRLVPQLNFYRLESKPR
jgi:hypothetical protein